jgi:undecaprenyl-diphosphatase
MKYSINRTRPFITYPDIMKKSGAASPSFPSGHTSGAFATATSVSLAYPKWYVIVPMFSWAGAVGYSRMDLGVHYPSDVLAGALVGAGSAWLTYYVNKKLINKAHLSHLTAHSSYTYKYPF